MGPKCAPKGTQNESRNKHENQVEKEIQNVSKRTPNINLSRIEREARLKIAKANTPYAQRKQVNLTSQEIVETILETKKGRTPYPQGEHAHWCLNRYFRTSTSKENPQRKGFTRREDKNHLPSRRPSGQICGTKTSKNSLDPTCSKREPEQPPRQERFNLFKPSCGCCPRIEQQTY